MNTTAKKLSALGNINISPKSMHGAKFKQEFLDANSLEFDSYRDISRNLEWKLKFSEKELKDILDWCTYQGNIDIYLSSKGDVFDMEVTIHDGEMLNGSRTGIRARLLYNDVPIDLVGYFEGWVDTHFKYLLDDMYESEQEQKKKNRVKQIEKELLTKY